MHWRSSNRLTIPCSIDDQMPDRQQLFTPTGCRAKINASMTRTSWIILACLVSFVSLPIEAATKKAVLIGINCYNPDLGDCGSLRSAPETHRIQRAGATDNKWAYWHYRNLEGALNDV